MIAPSDLTSKVRLLTVLAAIVWLSHPFLLTAREAPNLSLAEQRDRQFLESAPYSSAAEIGRHLGYSVPLPPYDLASEKFRIVLPSGYSTNQEWGLLVWISPE